MYIHGRLEERDECTVEGEKGTVWPSPSGSSPTLSLLLSPHLPFLHVYILLKALPLTSLSSRSFLSSLSRCLSLSLYLRFTYPILHLSCASSPPIPVPESSPPGRVRHTFPSARCFDVSWLGRHQASLQGWDQRARPRSFHLVTPSSLFHLSPPSSHLSPPYITLLPSTQSYASLLFFVVLTLILFVRASQKQLGKHNNHQHPPTKVTFYLLDCDGLSSSQPSL